MTQIAEASVKLSVNMDQFTQGMKLAVEEMNKVGQELTKMGAALSLKVTLPLSVAAGIAVKEFSQEADAVERLNIVLDSTKNIAGQTTDGILRMADAIQKTTRFSSTQVVEGAAMLATFQKVRNVAGANNDIFDRAVKTAANLAAGGRDLAGVMQMLGRALENPAMGMQLLRRQGIIFTETEKDAIRTLIETNKVLDAQKMILDKVQAAWKDAAERMAKTPAGHFAQMWNEVKDALKDAGKVLVAVLVPMADAVKFVAQMFKALPSEVKGVIVVLLGLAGVLGPLLIAIANVNRAMVFFKTIITLGSLKSGIATLIGLLAKLRIAFMALSPVTLAIGLAVIAATVLWTKYRKEANAALDAAKEATDKNRQLLTNVTPEEAVNRMKHFGELVRKNKDEIDGLTRSLINSDLAQSRLNATVPKNVDLSGAASLEEIMPGFKPTTAPTQPSPGALPPPVVMTEEEKTAAQERIKSLKAWNAEWEQLIKLWQAIAEQAPSVNEVMENAITEANKKMEQSQTVAKAMGLIMGRSFNVAAVQAQAMEENIKAVAQAMAVGLQGQADAPQQIARRVAELTEKFKAFRLAAKNFDIGQSFTMAVQESQILARIMGPAFNQTTAEAAAMKSMIDATIKAMQDERMSVDQITEAVKGLTAAWRNTALRGAIEESEKGLERANKQAEVMRRVMGPTFDKTGAMASALQSHIEGVAAAMLAEGKSIEEVEKAISHLAIRLKELQTRPGVGDFLREQLQTAADSFLDLLFAAETTDTRVQALREQIATLEKGIKEGADTTGEMTLQLSNLRGELVEAESASKSFFDHLREFIRQALIDFTKLLLQVQLMKLVMGIGSAKIEVPSVPEFDASGIPAFDPASIGAGSLPDIPSVPELPGAAMGAKFAPGELGLVGEAGPEIIRAGRSGATVARIAPTPKGKESDERVSVTVHNHVTAMDSRDVSRLFQENEGAVGSAVSRAVQRSFTLRKSLNR